MTARHQTRAVTSTTPATIVGEVLPPVIPFWLDTQLHSYPQHVLLPRHFVARLLICHQKHEKRATIREHIDRNSPDAFGIYDS